MNKEGTAGCGGYTSHVCALHTTSIVLTPAVAHVQFKDNVYAPQPETGWSGDRSRRLGEETVDAIAALLGDLR